MSTKDKKPVHEFLNMTFPSNIYIDENGEPNRPSGTIVQSRSIKKAMDMNHFNYGKDRTERQESVYYTTGIIDDLNENIMKTAVDVSMKANKTQVFDEDLEESMRRNHEITDFVIKFPYDAYTKGAGIPGHEFD